MLDAMKIGKRISISRQDKGMTQEQIAVKLGVTPQAVSRWERGNSMPDIEFLLPISGMLEISLEDLLTGDVTAKDSIRETKEYTPVSVIDLLSIDEIRIYFSCSLIPLIDQDQGGDLLDRIVMIRKQFALEYGIVLPIIRLTDDENLPEHEYKIFIRGKEKDSGKISCINDGSAVFAAHMTEAIKQNLTVFISREMAKILADAVAIKYPLTVEEAVPGRISYGQLAKLIIGILNKGKPVRDMYTILSFVCDANNVNDMDLLVEQIATLL